MLLKGKKLFLKSEVARLKKTVNYNHHMFLANNIMGTVNTKEKITML